MTFKATQEFIKKLDYDFCENMFRKELSKLEAWEDEENCCISVWC